MKKLSAILLVGLIMSAGIAFLWSCGGGGSDTNTYYQDADADGYGDAGVSQELEAPLAGWVLDSTDCDDSDTSVNPASTEVCTDWLDNDCNNDTDCYDLLCAPDPACASCVDSDGDGYYAVDLNCSGGNDCADADSTVNPGVDADGDTVDACQDCDDADSTTGTGTTEVCNDFDDDCDTVIDEDWITGGTVTYTDLTGRAVW